MSETASNKVCGTCRHKGPAVVHQQAGAGASVTVVATGLSVCLAVRHVGMVRTGAGDATTDLAPEDLQVAAGVADRTGHGAALCVRDDFGCNRWQPA